MSKLPPPKTLSQRAQAFWKALVPRRCASPERLLLLELALEALDRADTAAEILTREGLVCRTESTGAMHAHPAVKLEADAKRQFLRAWLALGLDRDDELDPPKEGGGYEDLPRIKWSALRQAAARREGGG